MKITLDTQEVNQVVVEYLANQGLIIDATEVKVTFDETGVTIDTNTHTTNKPHKEKKTEKAVTQTHAEQSQAEPEEEPAVVRADDTVVTQENYEGLEDDTPQIPTTESSLEKTRKLFS